MILDKYYSFNLNYVPFNISRYRTFILLYYTSRNIYLGTAVPKKARTDKIDYKIYFYSKIYLKT